MIPRELAKKIRYIQIHTIQAVNDVLAGEYESVFKGRGMEFDEVREYSPGDEIRTIDWNVTARTGNPLCEALCGGARTDRHVPGGSVGFRGIRHRFPRPRTRWRPRSAPCSPFPPSRTTTGWG